MCVRKENEPWWAYAFRRIVERPRLVLAIAEAAMLYVDLLLYIEKQIEEQAESVRGLTELSIRIQAIEHRIESGRTLPPESC